MKGTLGYSIGYHFRCNNHPYRGTVKFSREIPFDLKCRCLSRADLALKILQYSSLRRLHNAIPIRH